MHLVEVGLETPRVVAIAVAAGQMTKWLLSGAKNFGTHGRMGRALRIGGTDPIALCAPLKSVTSAQWKVCGLHASDEQCSIAKHVVNNLRKQRTFRKEI
ncbi:hypothetical protein [Phyllobacterium sp. OV277]|uniref:hypothetical protein n=1 Tax=Phyllobacterium sp. OV277 TaxID=1882772 RepID=UPI00111446F6|nr:hypothetical protein [Phyllobacterium sp. OV277]